MLEPTPGWLLGRWRLLRADPLLDFAPGVRMDFKERGRLRYTITVDGHDHEFALVYAVQGDRLETDNPEAAHRASTRFRRGEADTLVFDFSGALAAFVRER